jgi:hypothetical protein
MSWVRWLKGLAERLPDGDDESPEAARGTAQVRPPRKGGEAYAKEWVKVLEETGPDRDPFSTYTWDLQPGAPPVPAAAPRPPGPKPPGASPADPVDTYTWELHETDSREDPWGLKAEAPAERPVKKDGVNPYDTGLFEASWTGRFDKR